MKVLWMTYGVPYPPDSGVRQRDFHLIREVAKAAEVHLFSLAPCGGHTDPGALSTLCRCVEVFPMPAGGTIRSLFRFAGNAFSGIPVGAVPNYFPAAAERLRTILERERIDVFQVEHSLRAAYGKIGKPRDCRTVLSLHNVGFQQYSSMAAVSGNVAVRGLYRLKSAAMKRTERFYAPRYDRCVVVSAREKQLLERIAPGARTAVVDNGVDCSELRPLPEEGGAPVLLLAGVMNYPPNADAAIHFAEAILPRIRRQIPDVRLCIAGHSPTAEVRALERIAGVEVTGFVRDILPWYRRATAAVVPLRAGGGTRLKVLEAMALGRAVVSTPVGCEGLEVVSGQHLEIAAEPDEFAACVVELLTDPGRRRCLAAEARRLVEDRYDWGTLGRRLLDIYKETLDEVGA